MSNAEEMNEICQKGKGSRGGKGAWKKRHPGKSFTRQQSQREREDQEAAWGILQNEIKARVKPKMVKGADAMLLTLAKSDVPAEPHKFWDVLMGHQQTYIPKARELHRKAVEQVYSVFIRMVADGLDRHLPLLWGKYSELARSRGWPMGPRTMRSQEEILRMIIRLTLVFDVGEGKKDYNVVWRIVSSITNFLNEGIAPTEIQRLPGGIDDWSRTTFTGFRTPKETRAEVRALSTTGKSSMAELLAYLDDDVVPEPAMRPTLSPLDRIVASYCKDQGLADNGIMLLMVKGDPTSSFGATVVVLEHFSPVQHLEDDDQMVRDYFQIIRIAERVLTGSMRPVAPKRVQHLVEGG